MPPEAFDHPEASAPVTPWKATAAAVWIVLVTLGYLGTIVMERGERIVRILSSIIYG